MSVSRKWRYGNGTLSIAGVLCPVLSRVRMRMDNLLIDSFHRLRAFSIDSAIMLLSIPSSSMFSNFMFARRSVRFGAACDNDCMSVSLIVALSV